jgi:hypothetical protein
VDFTKRGKLMDEALDVIVRAFLDEYPSHDGPTWRGARRRAPPASRAAAAATDLDRRQHPGRAPAAPPRRATAGSRRARSATSSPTQVATVREHRKKLRGDEPIEIAANTPWLYLGTPAFEMPAGSVTGSGEVIAASLRELAAMGADMCGVRFRSRSCDELCDQIDAFGRDVAPLLDGAR